MRYSDIETTDHYKNNPDALRQQSIMYRTILHANIMYYASSITPWLRGWIWHKESWSVTSTSNVNQCIYVVCHVFSCLFNCLSFVKCREYYGSWMDTSRIAPRGSSPASRDTRTATVRPRSGCHSRFAGLLEFIKWQIKWLQQNHLHRNRWVSLTCLKNI